MSEIGNWSDNALGSALPLPEVPSAREEEAFPSEPETADAITVQDFAGLVDREIHKVLVGQHNLVQQLTVALLAGGHVLLEGVPGTAKTLTVRALARIMDISFKRVQFTPDMMPSDILGTNVFDPRDQDFHLKRGPIFTGLLLADEINRTPPKTQSALLEAMEERRVTIDGVSFDLPDPFLVCATQNPIEFEGTYPLPEAQLDRFMLKIVVDYPSISEEESLLARVQLGFRSQNLESVGLQIVLANHDLTRYRAEVERIHVAPSIQRYIIQIVRATRDNRNVTLGASPRAAITLLLTTKALAAMQGRAFVNPDDVKAMAGPALRHRIVIRPEAEMEGVTGDNVVESVLQSVEVPR